MMKLDTLDGNKLIAAFMGYVLDDSFPDKGRVYRRGSKLDMDTDFQYHTSWDWLIPVYNKCAAVWEELPLESKKGVRCESAYYALCTSIQPSNDEQLHPQECWQKLITCIKWLNTRLQ